MVMVIKMSKWIKITEEEYKAVKTAAKKNKHKRTDKKLQVIILRYEGMTCEEIGKKIGYSRQCVSRLCREFKTYGVNEYIKSKYKGNHRSLSIEEEDEILAEFEEKANKGQIISIQQIKAAFDKKIGKDTGRGYIYMVLKRKGWRKVMPRSKHPKKAGREEIEAAKKTENLHKSGKSLT